MRRRDFIRLGARLGTGLAAIYAAGPTAASAQSYPVRPVKLVVPYPPGGVVDVVARHWAEKAGSIIGGSFVVENQAGGCTVWTEPFATEEAALEAVMEVIGTIRNFVREAVCHIPPNLSPKATANCVFASNHSRGGRFQSATA